MNEAHEHDPMSLLRQSTHEDDEASAPAPGPIADAITALTTAARRTRTIGAGTPNEPADFAEIACHVLTAVAANVGSVEQLLAGRPGSWEAGAVRGLITKNAAEEDLPRWRTEPIRVCIDPGAEFYEIADLYELTEVHDAYEDALEQVREARYLDHPAIKAVNELATKPTLLPPAEATDEDVAENKRAWGLVRAAYQVLDADPEAQAATRRLETITARRAAMFETWRTDVLAGVTKEAARRGYTVPVIDDVDTVELTPTEWDLSVELVDVAMAAVPIPGTDILPGTINDYDDPQTRQRISDQLKAAGLTWHSPDIESGDSDG